MTDEQYTPLFALGAIMVTPAALDLCGDDFMLYIKRHVIGSWEESPEGDRLANHMAILSGFGRIMSTHTVSPGRLVWVITEADGSYITTTLLLPGEY